MRHCRPDVPLQRGLLDEQGQRLCCFCRKRPVEKGRRDWCGDECVQRYLIASGDQNAARRHVWKRDLGICQLCRVDTVPRDEAEWFGARHYGGRSNWPRPGKWEADHIVPIAEGGSLTPENLRTLCVPCRRSYRGVVVLVNPAARAARTGAVRRVPRER